MAGSPSRCGQAAAKPSKVVLPNSWASASTTSSYLNLFPSSPRSNSKVQPPWTKSSEPPGSSITPSSEMNSVATNDRADQEIRLRRNLSHRHRPDPRVQAAIEDRIDLRHR